MFKPTIGHHTFKDVYVKLLTEFGWEKADQIYRWAQYYTYKDDRDFYNVLNEHPDVIKFVQEKREGQLLGNVWGVPYPENKS
jgi:hypothetical protein